MLKEFKQFAVKGNVLDMAVGIIIGAAFGTIVKSFVVDVIMPPVGLLFGNVDFSSLYILLKDGAKAMSPYASLADARAAGAVTINYGVFINNIISFLLVGWTMFMVIKSFNKFKRKEEEKVPAPAIKDCPHCFTSIPIKATRCPNCTSEIK